MPKPRHMAATSTTQWLVRANSIYLFMHSFSLVSQSTISCVPAVFPAAVNMLYFTQQTELLKPLLIALTACVTRNGSVHSHSLIHSLNHSFTYKKSQDRLQMFGGLKALSDLLEDLVKQAGNVDQLQLKMTCLIS